MATKTLQDSSISQSKSTTPNPYLIIILSLSVFAFTPIVIRLALNSGFSPITITAGRLLITSMILTPLIFRRHLNEFQQLPRRTWLLTIISGAWLAIHFISLMISLNHTSIMLNQVILATSPLWIALIEVIFFRGNISKVVWIGILFAILGSSIIVFASPEAQTENAIDANRNILGIGIGVVSAIGMAAYLVVGKRARANLSFIPYVWLVYLSGAIIAIITLIVTQTSITPDEPIGYVYLFFLAVLSQLIGHSGMNYALRYLPATVIGISSQLIVISSSILAFFILAEVPAFFQIIGSGIIIVGVIFAIRGQNAD